MAGYLGSNAAVGPYLADQLLLPLALAGGGRFTTVRPSLHSRTAAEVIAQFLDVHIAFEDRPGRRVSGPVPQAVDTARPEILHRVHPANRSPGGAFVRASALPVLRGFRKR